MLFNLYNLFANYYENRKLCTQENSKIKKQLVVNENDDENIVRLLSKAIIFFPKKSIVFDSKFIEYYRRI
jgi:hypothetical protein